MTITPALLGQLVEQNRPLCAKGALASYIPELLSADAQSLGVSIAGANGSVVSAGDAGQRFTIQSISKVFIFTCALLDSGVEKVLQKVSLEPTGDAFNSITSLETKNFNKPLNPFINAGAIACLTRINGADSDARLQRILAFCRAAAGNLDIGINEAVYRSEKETGARNRALAYYMKSTGIIEGDVEELLDAYFRICAIEMRCEDLARVALLYAQNGAREGSSPLFGPEVAQVVKATMTMCGMYDESGIVAARVGVPCKSGVGGGIMAVVPGRMGIGIYGPSLNAKGSSVAGLALLEQLGKELSLSVF